jgi:hypothetical protein
MPQRLAAVRLISCAVIGAQHQERNGVSTQQRLSNKQSLVICANFERGLFKNAARPPVDDFISRSQN